MSQEFDVDAELDAWKEVQAMDAYLLSQERNQYHRCPPSMPPCPECEAREEHENEKEFIL